MMKYNSISFKHWHNIFKFRKRRAKKFAKILKKLINKKTRYAVQIFSALVTNKKFFKKFILERENFLYNLKDHDFLI